MNGKVGLWIHIFLSNTHQLVAVNGTTSSEAQLEVAYSRVSAMAAPIPIIHISDINNEITDSTVSCSADGARILLGIKY